MFAAVLVAFLIATAAWICALVFDGFVALFAVLLWRRSGFRQAHDVLHS
jgi:hypothetical protein